MNKSSRFLKRLRGACGSPVNRVCVELYFYANERNGNIFSVGIEFQNGFSVLFGCAGDGSVLINKGQCRNSFPTPNEKIVVHELKQFSSSILEEVIQTDTQMRLRFTSGVLVIENVYDELEITIDGKELKATELIP